MGTDSSFGGFVEFDSWFNVMMFEIKAEAQDPAHQEGFSWPNTRTSSASHLSDKTRSVGHALSVFADEGNISARARPQNLRNATAIVIVASATFPPNPRKKQQLQYFNTAAITTTATAATTNACLHSVAVCGSALWAQLCPSKRRGCSHVLHL